mmetsp:Transcript_1276/g.3591  ORF Transcript_1276/g.3591 Transcript_1276/m.3591 type:complete len:234 (+) Transcript_1276:465-1166(+)
MPLEWLLGQRAYGLPPGWMPAPCCAWMCAWIDARRAQAAAAASSSGRKESSRARCDTTSPSAACTPPIMTSVGALSVCSIFIASSTISGSPALTASPSLTSTRTILPGIGECTADWRAAVPAAEERVSWAIWATSMTSNRPRSPPTNRSMAVPARPAGSSGVTARVTALPLMLAPPTSARKDRSAGAQSTRLAALHSSAVAAPSSAAGAIASSNAPMAPADGAAASAPSALRR